METPAPMIARRDEHDRLVNLLTDERFFLPVALTTALPGARGFGKTILARAVCADSRIRGAFSDGIYWIRLGGAPASGGLPVLELLSRIANLLRDLTGEEPVLENLEAAEARLHEVLQPRRTLLVIDEVDDGDLLQRLLKAGPGGACLLITHDDTCLPTAARRVPGDVMMPGEALALLLDGLVEPDLEAALDASVGASAESLAGRLNDWPLLLAMVNGLLRDCAAGNSSSSTTSEAIFRAHAALDEAGLPREWPVQQEQARRRALTAVLAACLTPLAMEQRERVTELAVFAPEESVALGALEALWDLPAQQARAFAADLARRRIVEMGEDGQRGWIRVNVALHDCLRDMLWAGRLSGLHSRLVDGYQKRCPSGWASGPDDGYYFAHLAMHLEASGRRDAMQDLLFDYDWLAHFLSSTAPPGARAGNLYALLADYDRALSISLDEQSAQLRLVKDALRLSARVLASDPAQLAPQLLGRLLPFDEPRIREMIRQAREEQGRLRQPKPWLRPLAGCFTPPGGDELLSLSGHEDWVTSVALLPGGQRALSGSLDGSLRLWDLASGQVLSELTALAAPGDVLADVEAGLPADLTAHASGVSALCITPNGLEAVSAGRDGFIRVWSLTSGGGEMRSIRAHLEPVGALALTPDGQHAITGADDRLIRVWNLQTGALERELVGHTDLVRALAVTSDGRTLVSGSWDTTLRLWDLESGKLIHILTGHTGWVRSLAVSPHGHFAVSGAWDRTLRVWDLRSGDATQVVEDFAAPVYSLAFNPDGRLLLAGGGDGTISLWAFDSMRRGRDLIGHTGGVNHLSVSSSGRFLVSGADDRTVRVWDLAAVHNSQPRLGHAGAVNAAALLPGGQYAITGSDDGTLKVWEPAAGSEVRSLAGHTGGVLALAVTADGGVVISGARDCTARLWDPGSGKEIRALLGHERPVTAVAITPDGRVAASGDEGGVVRAWDAANGACLASFRGEDAIKTCTLSPDGRVISAAEASGKMYFLEIRAA